MRIIRIILLPLYLFVLTGVAAAGDDAAVINRDWLLCQAGHASRCDHLLRAPLDEHTRMLVRVDHQFARERVAAHVNVLVGICDAQSNVKACDRALTYHLSDAERQRVLDIRHSIVQRGLTRGPRPRDEEPAQATRKLVQ
jgi:hypothetical protein